MTENPYLNPEIAAARKAVTAAKETMSATVARIQEACTHEKVAETDGVRSFEKNRICLCCGLEATERWASFAPDHPLGTEFVARVSSDRFYGYRP